MHTPRRQQTISTSVAIEGFGYWSGQDVRVEFRPAEPDTGVVFVRRDLPRTARIPAAVAHRVEAPRRTTLAIGSASVEMVEHILAALTGLRIDNCEVWINAAEMPGCDGSSQPFVVALESAGIVEQESARPELVVRSTMRLGSSDSWVEARPGPAGILSIKYQLDYGKHTAIGRQSLQLPVTPESFRRELAGSRTFILQEEAEWLVSRGLGQRVTPKNLLIFDGKGPIDNTLRWRDECVRHKMLDLVGDLALAGCDIVGHIIAYKSGHRLNADLVRALLTEEQSASARRRSA